MTRLYISADLEGVCGVTSPHQCDPDPKRDPSAYALAVSQLATEVNAVAEVAFSEMGVTHITVNDAHYMMTNLLLSELDPRVHLLSGKPKNCAMAAGLDASYDAMMLLGYHAKVGTERGILNHTFHSRLFDVRINGVSYGEGGVNALYAGLEFDVPVVMASGDKALCEELSALMPEFQTVCTKEAESTTSALCYPIDTVLKDYRESTRQALSDVTNNVSKTTLCKGISAPYTLEITFLDSLSCDTAMTLPWLKRIDGRRVEYTSDSFKEIYQALQSAYAVLAYSSALYY